MRNYNLILTGCNRPYHGESNQEENREILGQNFGYPGIPSNLHNHNLPYGAQQMRAYPAYTHAATPYAYSQSSSSRTYVPPAPPAPPSTPIPQCPKAPRPRHCQIPVRGHTARSGRQTHRVDKSTSVINHGQKNTSINLDKGNVNKLMDALVRDSSLEETLILEC